MQTSGGLIGYVVSAPLPALLSAWVAVPLLALLAAFGVLVVTGTPLHRVRERFAEFAFLVAPGSPGWTKRSSREADGEPTLRPAGRSAERGRDRGGRAATSLTTARCSADCCRAVRRAGLREGKAGEALADPAGRARSRSSASDDEVIAEALMFGAADARPRDAAGSEPASRPPSSGAEESWHKSWFGDESAGVAANDATSAPSVVGYGHAGRATPRAAGASS